MWIEKCPFFDVCWWLLSLSPLSLPSAHIWASWWEGPSVLFFVATGQFQWCKSRPLDGNRPPKQRLTLMPPTLLSCVQSHQSQQLSHILGWGPSCPWGNHSSWRSRQGIWTVTTAPGELVCFGPLAGLVTCWWACTWSCCSVPPLPASPRASVKGLTDLNQKFSYLEFRHKRVGLWLSLKWPWVKCLDLDVCISHWIICLKNKP